MVVGMGSNWVASCCGGGGGLLWMWWIVDRPMVVGHAMGFYGCGGPFIGLWWLDQWVTPWVWWVGLWRLGWVSIRLLQWLWVVSIGWIWIFSWHKFLHLVGCVCESVNPFSFHKTLNYAIYKSCGRVSIFGDLGLCCSKESCYYNRGWWTNQKFEVVSYVFFLEQTSSIVIGILTLCLF